MSGVSVSADVKAALESLTLPEYFSHLKKFTSSRSVLAFPRTYADFTYFTPQQVSQSSDQAAAAYCKRGLYREDGKGSSVIGIFAKGGIEWMISFVALVKLGHTVLCLSPRLSTEAISALTTESGCKTLVYGTLPKGHSAIPCHKIAMLAEEDLWPLAPPVDHKPLTPQPTSPETDVAVILHSSGSTGLPKLVPKTQFDIMRLMKFFIMRQREKSIYVASGLYNGVGLLVGLSSFVMSGPTFYDNDHLPFTAEGYAQLLQEARPQVAFFTPYSLDLALSTKDGLEALKKCDLVTSFGAVCSQAIGDKAVANGIRLITDYGITEVAALMTSAFRPLDDPQWDYLTTLPPAKPHIEMRPLCEGEASVSTNERLFELIVLPSFPMLKEKWANSNDPPGSLHTGDTFLKHPTKEDYWKVVGRKDDQIKIYADDRQSVVNALVYESKIRTGNQDVVDDVVLFGQGRKRLGVLIFTKSGIPQDTALERVWATIGKEINGILKTGIEKKMLRAIEAGDQIPRTDKLNIIRPQVYLKYHDLIDSAYQSDAGKSTGSAGL
ncbi:hypothetical protein MMC13_007474 [Lambiella insularis]|nr:hypothetical protein [Lambiella insularis]